MHSKILIFLFLNQLFLSLALDEENLNYTIRLINHLRVQKGWDTIQHLSVNHLAYKNKTLGDVLDQKPDSTNVQYMFDIIVTSLNYKYNEVLKKFIDIVSLIKNECEYYLYKKSYEKLIECTALLGDGVSQSSFLFNVLFDAMKFISDLDIENLFDTKATLFTMEDELLYVKKYTNSLNTSHRPFGVKDFNQTDIDYAISFLSFLIKIIKEVSNITETITKERIDLIHTPVQRDYKIIFKNEYDYLKSKGYSKDFMYYMSHELMEFCKYKFYNDYEYLGFDELVHPKNNSKLIPPRGNNATDEPNKSTKYKPE